MGIANLGLINNKLSRFFRRNMISQRNAQPNSILGRYVSAKSIKHQIALCRMDRIPAICDIEPIPRFNRVILTVDIFDWEELMYTGLNLT